MVTSTVEGFDAAVTQFKDAPQRIRGAVVRSLNRAIISGRTLMARLITEDTGVKVSDVKAAFQLEKASDSRPTASLGAGMKRIPLIQFKASGPEPSRGRGHVSYRLQGQKVFALGSQNAFIATMSSGHRGVFSRVTPSTRKSSGARSKNLPIRELLGPSVGHVFIKFQSEGQARLEESFKTNFEHEMERLGFTPAGDALPEEPDEGDGTD